MLRPSGGAGIKPTTPWVLDKPASRCQLARKFGKGEKAVLLTVRAYQPGYTFEITVAGDPVRFVQKGAHATIAYGTGAPRDIALRMLGNNRDYGPATIFSDVLVVPQDTNPVAPDAAFEAQFDRIALAARPDRRVVLETGPMAPALTRLGACTDSLLRRWGLDPRVQHGLRRTVTANDLDWVKHVGQTFPPALMFTGKQARLHLQLVVDAQGVPTHCETAQSYADSDFEVRACDVVMARARFHPALDEAGQPVASYYGTTVNYVR